MKKTILFMLSTFLIHSTVADEHVSSHINDLQKNSVANMPADYTLELYQMMKNIHEVFTACHIEYWIQGGTLLGAVRHKGLIPWDDDIDVNINIKDEGLFLALRPLFASMGYHYHLALGKKSEPVRFYSIVSRNITQPKTPCVDIFLTNQNNDNTITYTPYHWFKRDNRPIFITKDELYPLKEYQFGELTVMGPNNPIPYLNASFGTDWLDYAVKFNHLSSKIEKVALSLLEKNPAQPTGPLREQFTDIHIDF